VPIDALRVDGGAAASDLLMQIQADFCGIPVDRPRVLETTAVGAALLARRGIVGASADLGAMDAVERRFVATLSAPSRASQRLRWKRAVDAARAFGSPAQISLEAQ
jgi:glycerol kinase